MPRLEHGVVASQAETCGNTHRRDDQRPLQQPDPALSRAQRRRREWAASSCTASTCCGSTTASIPTLTGYLLMTYAVLSHLQGSTIFEPLPPSPPSAGIGRHGAGPPGHARAARPAGRQLVGQLAARDAAAGDDGELGGGRVPWRRSLLGRRRGRATRRVEPRALRRRCRPFWPSCRSQGGRVARAATSCVRLRTSSLRNT